MTGPASAPADDLTGHLNALADSLVGIGLIARPLSRSRHPGLKVTNPEVTQLSETIYAARSGDGTAWFWWSWGERIDLIGNEPEVAATIVKVLS
jgi:hypothetical protein